MTLLKETTFVCIDCETTGLDIKNDRVIEVAIALFRGDEILAKYESLVNPLCDIPESSYSIHKISKEMVSESPTINLILPEVFKLAARYPIIGHGIDFDIEILYHEAQRYNLPTHLRANTRVDTLRLGRLYGESPSNSLEMLRSHFNIEEEGAHRAMNDVMVNIQVFQHLTKSFKTYPQIIEALSKPILMKTMPLGKYKGRLFKDLPPEYLQWAARQNFDQDLLFSLRHEAQRRKKGGLFSQAANPFQDL